MRRAPDILLEIVAARRRRLHALGSSEAPPVRAATGSGASFVGALGQRRGYGLIAEVKMGSPKLGDLRGRFDPLEQARTYAEAGAAALSVVVEPDYFHGSYALLQECQRASGLPAIAKDFVVSRKQIEWAREAGASAVLLIASLYEAEELAGWATYARELGLVPLIETHDEEDLQVLDAAGGDWEIVGINNRDLRTFQVSLEHSMRLVGKLPESTIRVAESGIAGAEDVERLRSAGFDAFLVGESLIKSGDVAESVRSLVGDSS